MHSIRKRTFFRDPFSFSRQIASSSRLSSGQADQAPLPRRKRSQPRHRHKICSRSIPSVTSVRERRQEAHVLALFGCIDIPQIQHKMLRGCLRMSTAAALTVPPVVLSITPLMSHTMVSNVCLNFVLRNKKDVYHSIFLVYHLQLIHSHRCFMVLNFLSCKPKGKRFELVVAGSSSYRHLLF